jgi:xylan 1,4-beta-xylosidase
VVDAKSAATPFPHNWEHMFGSCHASTTLCEDWRNDLRALREIVDVRYVRFHEIFEHQAGIYGGRDATGRLLLNFTRILIYDGLLEIGVAPFIELGFMPEELAERPISHQFWYYPNVSPPRDLREWYQLIYCFARHLVERDTVSNKLQIGISKFGTNQTSISGRENLRRKLITSSTILPLPL